MEKLKAIRNRQAPNGNSYKENVLTEISRELVAELYGVVPEPHHITAVIETRYASFLESVRLPDGVDSLLDSLASRYRLGMISNYLYAEVVRDGIEKIGIARFFNEVVISAEVGYIKPHPKPFEMLLSGMNLRPSECVHIGDNWLADIQGAKSIGMQAVFITQYTPNEVFEPRQGDQPPDARIADLDELGELLQDV